MRAHMLNLYVFLRREFRACSGKSSLANWNEKIWRVVQTSRSDMSRPGGNSRRSSGSLVSSGFGDRSGRQRGKVPTARRNRRCPVKSRPRAFSQTLIDITLGWE